MDPHYDIITVGGGLGGASLARAMAERGARVLVLEREKRFKDRVRGEAMFSWGAAEAKVLGIRDLLLAGCAHELSWWDVYVGPARVTHRDLTATTPQAAPMMTFFHPEMQEGLLLAATGPILRRVLRTAGHAYAAEHDRYYGALHTIEGWFTELFLTTGPEADTRRGRALALAAQDPTRLHDAFLSGPECAPVDETARRRRLFGEDP